MWCSSRSASRTERQPRSPDRRFWLVLGLCGPLGAWAQPGPVAEPPPPTVAVPRWRLQGTGSLRWLGLEIYTARLWLPASPQPMDLLQGPLALELRYARRIASEDLVERSLVEMERQGRLEPAQRLLWQAALRQALPTVAPGDRLLGLMDPRGAQFFHNGRPTAAWTDGELSRRFFAIWLGPNTSEPALRQALSGAP